MHPKAFNTVGANAGKYCRTGETQVLRDLLAFESTHLKVGRIAFENERFSIASDAEGRG